MDHKLLRKLALSAVVLCAAKAALSEAAAPARLDEAKLDGKF